MPDLYAEIEWYVNHNNGKVGPTEGSHTKIYGPKGTTVMPRSNHPNEQQPKGTLHVLFKQLRNIGIFILLLGLPLIAVLHIIHL